MNLRRLLIMILSKRSIRIQNDINQRAKKKALNQKT